MRRWQMAHPAAFAGKEPPFTEICERCKGKQAKFALSATQTGRQE